MEVALCRQLSKEKQPKNLVPNPLLVRCQALCEDISQPPKSLGEVIVRAGEVEHPQVHRKEILGRGYRVEVLQQVRLELFRYAWRARLLAIGWWRR